MAARDVMLTLAHSPDPDDAFMWWGLTDSTAETGSRVDCGRLRFETVMAGIETLNERSNAAEYDITAISCAQYPFVADRYAITSCGASFGEGYGPKLVTRDPTGMHELIARESPIAVPGLRTTAALLTGMITGCARSRLRAIPFDEMIDRVASGEFEAGVVIHEGQLTFEDAGLHLVCDLGEWWWKEEGLPLPLGLNVIRRDLDARHGEGVMREAARLLRASIDFAAANREQAVAYSMQYARGVSTTQADEFVRMYVNRLTLDSRPDGVSAIHRLLRRAATLRLTPSVERVDVVDCQPR